MLPAIPPEGLPLPGNERYVLRALLGRGGFGEAYLAEDQALARKVVIKLLTDLGDATIRDRFTREARIAANIKHPSVVQVHDIGALPDGRPYFVMEFADGQSLAQRLAERGVLPVQEALTLMAEVAEGLASAHRMSVIHRDIKPENILVTSEGKAKLIDFGIAKKALDEGEKASTDVTRDGVVLGTPRYVSPEQALAKPLDATSDLYSLGCVIYALLTGRSPFDGNAQELLVHHAHTPAPTLSAGVSTGGEARTFSPALEGIVARLLSKDAARRIQDGDELARALRREVAALPAVSETRTAVATTHEDDATPLLAVSAVAQPANAGTRGQPDTQPDTQTVDPVVGRTPARARSSGGRSSRVIGVAVALVFVVGAGMFLARRAPNVAESAPSQNQPLAPPKPVSEASLPLVTPPPATSTSASTSAMAMTSVSSVPSAASAAFQVKGGKPAKTMPTLAPPHPADSMGAIEDR